MRRLVSAVLVAASAEAFVSFGSRGDIDTAAASVQIKEKFR